MHGKQQFSNSVIGTLSRAATVVLAMVVVPIVLASLAAQAQTFKVLYNFTGSRDGGWPYAGLTIDKAGNLYGTTNAGGTSGCAYNLGCGTVFKLSHKGSGWVLTPLYNFQGWNDGAYPAARVIFGPDGTLYGTTSGGGNANCSSGCGTVFNLKPQPRACTAALCPWTETVLYRFTGGSDGALPVGDLVFDQGGNLYGAASVGGVGGCAGRSGCGVIYELTRSNGAWRQTVLYSFAGGNAGCWPNGGVIFDQAGKLYGITAGCGALGQGTVYQLIPSGSVWTENTLFDFEGEYGTNPVGSLVFDVNGNLFGATQNDTIDEPWYPGTLFEVTMSTNNWDLQYHYDFSHQFPDSGVIMDAAGNLYGEAYGDRSDDYGQVYQLAPQSGGWGIRTLHTFPASGDGQPGPDGGNPYGPVVIDASANIYGTCSVGGASSEWGTVWEITP
jgi:uncharacterized repeat protein (TIGR03803 family)